MPVYYILCVCRISLNFVMLRCHVYFVVINIAMTTSRRHAGSLAVSFDFIEDNSIPQHTIEIPQEILSRYAEQDGNENGTRAVSFMYRSIDALFPVADTNR